MEKVKTKRDPLLHIVRRQDVTTTNKWIIRILAIGSAFLLCAIVSTLMGGTFADFFIRGFDACFVNLRDGGISATKVVSLLENAAILILLAIAVIPAFKMKFWNIGAEGQAVIAILVCCILQKYMGSAMDLNNGGVRFLFFVIIFICSILAGAIWAVIPAFFKAKFNTNETLFTLMMNYVALILTQVVIFTWSPDQGTVSAFDDNCYLPAVGGQQAVINIIIIAIVVALVFVFLKYTKRGYEISVVGGSTNTARYIGLSVKKTIIRTMIISGALCGLCGCLLVVGEHNNLTTTIVGGRGFTGVLIAWLSAFGPIELSLYSLLAAFMIKGGRSVNYNLAFPNIILGILFFVLIAAEFFVNYEVRCDKLEHYLRTKFPKLFKNKEAVALEAPTNINDMKDEPKDNSAQGGK